MKSPNAKINTSKRRKWLKRIVVTLAILILLPLTLFTIGWLNRDRVINVVQDWYSKNTTGTLIIGKVNASFISGFPNVGFTIKDIKHTNRDTISDQFSQLQIEEAQLTVRAGKLLRGEFIFQKIAIKSAVFSSEVISERSLTYHEKLKANKQKARHKGFQLPEWINNDGATVLLENVKYITKDSVLDKYFNLHIHSAKSKFQGNEFVLSGVTSMDVTVNNLGFNTQKGSFFNGARVTGRSNFIVDLERNTIEVPDFPLKIDHQTFQVSADFDLSDITIYKFRLQNPQTDFEAVKSLLTDSLSVKMQDFDIQKPFKTSANITGEFAYGNNPDINAEFSTINNDITIANKFHFKDASFIGKLTNDIYQTDSLRNAKRSTKDFRIDFNVLNGDLEDLKVDIQNSYFQSTPEALNFFEANVQLNGSNETLVDIIETDNFGFKGGKFQFNAQISGDIPNPYEFLNKATGTFNLNNTHVILKKNGLQLPIQSIAISLERENALLKKLIINLPNGEDLVFKGRLKNISGLVTKSPTHPTTSQISLDSENLNINELLVIMKEFVPSAQADNRKNLYETLETIYSQFHPQFHINIGDLKYNKVVINDVKSNIELINSETILLRNFSFKYDDAVTILKGKVRVYGPKSRLKNAIFLNADASSSGPISVFKDLFNIELFRIDSGDYKFNGHVTGNVKELSELLDNARGDLTLTNTSLYYEPAEMDIAIDSLSLFVDNSNILLKQFNLEIDELYPIKLDGNIKQFPNFLLDDKEDPGSIFLKVTAPFIDGDEILATVNAFKNEEKLSATKGKKPLYSIFKDINRFNPEIKLAIDSLKYKDLITENINAQIYFENDSILKLDHLNLNYKEAIANIHGEINAHTNQEELLKNNPFDLDFYIQAKGKSEDLNDYLKTTNFVFKSGHFEFNGNYKAQSKNLKLLNSTGFGDLKIGGTVVDYKAAGLQIPVDSLHIEINNNLATLKTLDIKLPGKSKVYFSGSIDHFSEFIEDIEDLNRHSSKFSIYSPYLDTANIQQFIEESNINDADAKEFDLKTWKAAMMKINTSFYPTITVKMDTLKHNNLNITDFESELLFDKESYFKIEDTKLNFHGGTIEMDLSVGIKNKDHTPVAIEMQANDLDLHDLLTDLDYFNDTDLRQADSIQGQLNYKITADGLLDTDGKLNMDSLNGILQLDLQNLALYTYKPIMENIPLMKADRFQNLRFQPIIQTFEIKNGEIIIPRTEIQSTAIHLFAEGRLKLNEYMNIWLSVPWKNLKRNDGLTLPHKTTYEDAGSKFFVQFIQDKNSKKARKQKAKIKVRLGNRKLRKLRNSQQ